MYESVGEGLPHSELDSDIFSMRGDWGIVVTYIHLLQQGLTLPICRQ